MRTTIWAAAVAVGVLGLAGCGSNSGGSSSASGSSSSAAAGSSSSSAAGAVLSTADSSLGKIVVAADGRTVYAFDKDTPGSGTSACTGDCQTKWPAVTTDSASPKADGVTGDVGTITRADGTKQVTLAGMPLYMYAADSHAGDVTGQGVGGLWWVVGPDGMKITTAAGSSSSAPAMPGY
jgi:predicted lipoprotein with Yx(FWY)xxD motif